jgi:hypothetical protein
MRNAYRIWVVKPEGRRLLGRTRCRWVNNIKTVLREIGWDGMDWIDLDQEMYQWRALVNTVMRPRTCYCTINGCFHYKGKLVNAV